MDNTLRPLLGLNLNELSALVNELGLPNYTAKQIMRWLYKSNIVDIEEMTDLSKMVRHTLKKQFKIGAKSVTTRCEASDGTVKYLFGADVTCGGVGNETVETVFIPDKKRGTICVSSQVGCRMSCAFCHTGRQGFKGNLTAGSIINQIRSLPEKEKLTNIVFMGQGEPLDNIENVLQATRLITSPEGFGMSPERITISTVGVRKGLPFLLDKTACHIAISLHSPYHEERQSIIPMEKQTPIADIIREIKNRKIPKRRRITFEYIVFEGVNDTLKHAKDTIKLLEGINCRINLIRYHPLKNSNLRGATEEKIMEMRNYFTAHGIFTTTRTSRGEDIWAACGMLSVTQKNISDNVE